MRNIELNGASPELLSELVDDEIADEDEFENEFEGLDESLGSSDADLELDDEELDEERRRLRRLVRRRPLLSRVPRRPRRLRPRGVVRPVLRRKVVVRRSEPCICPARTCPAHGSEYIRWVQSALNQRMGLNLRVNGVMNPATRDALRQFQQQQGLPSDGIAGPETKRALLDARGGGARDAAAVTATSPDAPESAADTELFEYDAVGSECSEGLGDESFTQRDNENAEYEPESCSECVESIAKEVYEDQLYLDSDQEAVFEYANPPRVPKIESCDAKQHKYGVVHVVRWKNRYHPCDRRVPSELDLAILSRARTRVPLSAVKWAIEEAKAERKDPSRWVWRIPSEFLYSHVDLTIELFYKNIKSLKNTEIVDSLKKYLILRHKNEKKPLCNRLFFLMFIQTGDVKGKADVESRYGLRKRGLNLDNLYKRAGVKPGEHRRCKGGRQDELPGDFLLLCYITLPNSFERELAPLPPPPPPETGLSDIDLANALEKMPPVDLDLKDQNQEQNLEDRKILNCLRDKVVDALRGNIKLDYEYISSKISPKATRSILLDKDFDEIFEKAHFIKELKRVKKYVYTDKTGTALAKSFLEVFNDMDAGIKVLFIQLGKIPRRTGREFNKYPCYMLKKSKINTSLYHCFRKTIEHWSGRLGIECGP